MTAHPSRLTEGFSRPRIAMRALPVATIVHAVTLYEPPTCAGGPVDG